MDDNMNDELNSSIAIVGMDARFPGCASVDELWEVLVRGEEKIEELSEEQMLCAGVPRSTFSLPGYVRRASVLEDIDLFDAEFFGIGPREAELMDPQQRLLLECSWKAFEDAGVVPGAVPGPVGVYASTTLSKYLLNNLLSHRDTTSSRDAFLSLVGNDKDYLATNIAYRLQLRGPALTVQTACSSSLVAVHLACQGLLLHECDVALAGGAAVRVPTASGHEHLPGGIWSPDGRTRPFDANGQGTIFGSGVGCVILKRYEDAVADGSHIYAIIRGSAINNDGSRKVGFTAPSVDGQAEVVASALRAAGVQPEQVSYIEAHGTATSLGDPIEIAALDQAFRSLGYHQGICAIGSIKGNFGHMDVAAGIAGLIKVALLLKKRLLVPSINFDTPNPKIGFENTPFRVITQKRSWGSTLDETLFAGLSSFGIGGTNVHVVLQSDPLAADSREECAVRDHLVVLSAKTREALVDTINVLQPRKAAANASWADTAYTLATGRAQWPVRSHVVVRDGENPEALMHRLIEGISAPKTASVRRKTVFVVADPAVTDFEYETAPRHVCATIDQHDTIFRRYFGISIADARSAASEINSRRASTIAYRLLGNMALIDAMRDCGIAIDAWIGRGDLGELICAWAIGALSVEQVISFIAGDVLKPASEVSITGTCYSEGLQAWIDAENVGDWFGMLSACVASSDVLAPTVVRRFGNARAIVIPGFRQSAIPSATGGGSASMVFDPLEKAVGWADVLRVVGSLWNDGMLPDWHSVFPKHTRRLVRACTYPFQRRRFWIDPLLCGDEPVNGPRAQSTPVDVSTTDARSGPLLAQASVYVPSWHQIGLTKRVSGRRSAWWVVTQDETLRCALDSALERREGSVAFFDPQLLAGGAWPASEAPEWAAKLRSKIEFGSREDAPTDLVIDLRMVDGDGACEPVAGALDGVFVLRSLMSALSGLELGGLKVHVLTLDGCDVLGTELCASAAVAVIAAVKVWNQESDSEVRYDVVDSASSQSSITVLVRALFTLSEGAIADTIVAVRGERAWALVYELSPQEDGGRAFRRGATYVISGGHGRLGKKIARLLQTRYGANVALLSRNADPVPVSEDVDCDAAGIVHALEKLPQMLDHIERGRVPVSLESFGPIERDLESFVSQSIWCALDEAADGLASVRTRAELEMRLGVRSTGAMLLDFALSSLTAEGWLEMRGGEYRWLSDAMANPREAEGRALELSRHYPEFSGLVELIAHCASHLVEVLRGERDSLQVLYPDGNVTFLAQKSERIQDYSNLSHLRDALTQFVCGLADARSGGRPLRILEVGGGNGVLTKQLAEALRGKNVEYVFTDIGRTFIVEAKRFAAQEGLDFMSFRRFDISDNARAQGFEPGTFDLVLALDVVHATPEVETTVRTLKELLVPGGAICMIELVKAHLWTHFIFGFLPGWWTFTDAPLRSGSPLLTTGKWTAVLENAGFSQILTLPGDGASGARAEKMLAIAVAPYGGECQQAALSVRADVTDRKQVEEALVEVVSRFGSINGILHAAAFQESGAFAELSRESIELAVATKVKGAEVLAEAVRKYEPDFMVCFSSLAAVTGMPFNGGYCIANAMMDARVMQLGRKYPFTLSSIAWDRWETSADLDLYGIGDRVANDGGESALRSVKVWSMALDEGFRILEALIGQRYSGHVAVSKTELSARIRRHEALKRGENLPSKDLENTSMQTRDERSGVRNQLLEIWYEVLGVKDVGLDDDFFDLGGDSLAALQMMNLIKTKLDVRVSASEMMQAQSIRLLEEMVINKKHAVEA